MDHEEAKLQEHFEKLKANSLVFERNSDISQIYNVAIKHISGKVFCSSICHYTDIPKWIDDNIEQAICLSKQYLTGNTEKLNGYSFPKGAIFEECKPLDEAAVKKLKSARVKDEKFFSSLGLKVPHGVFVLSVTTPYTEEQILEFMALSGKKIEQTTDILRLYARVGIDITTVNHLIKMGDLKYE